MQTFFKKKTTKQPLKKSSVPTKSSVIPPKMRKELEGLSRMKKCEHCGSTKGIEWHHALIYAGRKMQEVYAIRALCVDCHRGENGTINAIAKQFTMLCAITEGLTKGLEQKYPKCDWRKIRRGIEKQMILW